MLDIVEATEGARYSSVLEEVIRELGGVEILRLDYDSEEVDIDVLLEDGRVFRYEYDVTDCTWWDKIELKFVRDEMLEDSICYASLEIYESKMKYLQRMSRFGWEPQAHA